MDVNDILRPFGFYVHGCIDGFKRKIIWLQVANTNKNRAVIAYYFLKKGEAFNEPQRKLGQILDQRILMYMAYRRFFG